MEGKEPSRFASFFFQKGLYFLSDILNGQQCSFMLYTAGGFTVIKFFVLFTR